MTTRSPIHTWGTHWGTVADPLAKGEDYAWKRKLGRIRGQYEAQLRLAEKAPFIHKVEGDIDNLGEFLGLDLPKDNNTFSRPTPMKEALRNKDVEAIEKLCYGTDFFTCFRDSITPDIKDFYEDLGYDIWWT